MQIVLDTCALISFLSGESMHRTAIEAIESAQTRATVWVPSIAAMEIAQKAAVSRLRLPGGSSPRAWFTRAERAGL
jgi:PIN domain nuclease of toxin-antitoxin system